MILITPYREIAVQILKSAWNKDHFALLGSVNGYINISDGHPSFIVVLSTTPKPTEVRDHDLTRTRNNYVLHGKLLRLRNRNTTSINGQLWSNNQ